MRGFAEIAVEDEKDSYHRQDGQQTIVKVGFAEEHGQLGAQKGAA